jgi:hypothetical protein
VNLWASAWPSYLVNEINLYAVSQRSAVGL